VTFDFWNTIVRAPAGLMSEARRRAIVDVCAECGVELDAELLAEGLGEATRAYERSWSVGEHFHPRQGAEILVRSLELEGAVGERAAEAFLTVARDARVELSAGIRPSLAALRERGIVLGIVCDVGFSGGAVPAGAARPRGAARVLHRLGFLRRGRPLQAGAAALGMRTVRYRALHDDPEIDGGVEADFILDRHRDLPELIDRLGEP